MSNRYNIDPPPAQDADDELVAEMQQTSLSELKAKLEIERFREDVRDGLECCLCPQGKTDKRLVILGAQITLSLLITLFSFYKLSSSQDQDNTVYVSLVTSVFSYWSGKSISSGSSRP